MSEAVSPFEPAEPVVATLAGAVDADLELLAALQVRVRGGSAAEWRERIARTLRGERNVVVVARVGGEVAGYANVIHLARHPDDGAPGGYYLMGVSVAPEWRRRGSGTG